MRETSCECIVEKLRTTARARKSGLSCPDAVLEAYRSERGGKFPAAVELAGELPGLLGEPMLCDVSAVTFAIIVGLARYSVLQPGNAAGKIGDFFGRRGGAFRAVARGKPRPCIVRFRGVLPSG